jgi:molybdate/tungstate transport system substrate-binding protein
MRPTSWWRALTPRSSRFRSRFNLFGALALLLLGCQGTSEVTVFCAASLHPTLSDAAERFAREHPKTRVSIQPSGSLVAARKLTELGMRADLIAVADAEIIDQMLIPRYASWNIEFLTNEIVIAHRDHSPFTDQISTDTWPALLLRSEVRLGCANPDTAPIGYNTLFVWQLTGSSVGPPDLADRLRARCAVEHVAPDEEELVQKLEARAIDYAFVYRSTAETHHLKITPLLPEVNLSRPGFAPRYAAAAVQLRLSSGSSKTMRGRPIVYGLTIPTGASNPQGARHFIAFLLSDRGRRIFERAGFHVPRPAPCREYDALSAELKPFTTRLP